MQQQQLLFIRSRKRYKMIKLKLHVQCTSGRLRESQQAINAGRLW